MHSMLVHRDLDHLPAFRRAVLTIGTFDGVHRGHQQIIRQLREEAAACGGESVIITFHPHPREVLAPHKNSLHLLNTLDEKTCLLERQQVDHLVVVPFTKAFSALSPEAYISDFLVRKFHPHTIIIGYDHRFGHDRAGDIQLLRSVEPLFGFRVTEIPRQVVHDLTVSSTRIRQYLEAGDITLADELLGYPYFVSGEVIAGDRLGRELGYPTANLAIAEPKKLIPAQGVYAVEVSVGGNAPAPCHPETGPSRLKGVMSIGDRPTFRGTDVRLEVHLFDFNEDLYGRPLTVYFRDFIRPQLKFETTEALIRQMQADERSARGILNIE